MEQIFKKDNLLDYSCVSRSCRTNNLLENYNRIKKLLGNKHLIQWPKLISFLKGEEEHYKKILKDYDETKKSKILKNKISEYINNYYFNKKIRNENNTIVNSNINFDTDENKHNNDYIKMRFFNYNNNSCWLDSFLFIYKNIIFKIIKITIFPNFVYLMKFKF